MSLWKQTYTTLAMCESILLQLVRLGYTPTYFHICWLARYPSLTLLSVICIPTCFWLWLMGYDSLRAIKRTVKPRDTAWVRGPSWRQRSDYVDTPSGCRRHKLVISSMNFRSTMVPIAGLKLSNWNAPVPGGNFPMRNVLSWYFYLLFDQSHADKCHFKPSKVSIKFAFVILANLLINPHSYHEKTPEFPFFAW